MKKALAIAVASAFAVPAFAADVTISGNLSYHYNIADGSPDTIDNDIDKPNFTIKATSELANGWTVSGDMTMDVDAGANDGGDSITIAGPFGSVDIGDASGALDATGDWTDIAPENGGFGLDGDDHSIAWTLPTVMEGATVVLSMSPEKTSHGATATEAFGASLTYDLGAAQVYYGTAESKATGDNSASAAYDNAHSVSHTAFGFKTSVAGIYLAMERGVLEDAAGANNADTAEKVIYTGLAAKYSVDKITIGYERQNVDIDGASAAELSTYHTTDHATAISDANVSVGFVNYNFGEGLNAFVEVKTDGKDAADDETVIGVNYSF